MKEINQGQQPKTTQDLGWNDVDESAPIISAGPRFAPEENAAYEAGIKALHERREAELDAAWNPETGEYEF